jgi:hypothetical protein
MALLVLVWSLFAVWLSNRALAPITPRDAGIYHLGSIRWAQQFPIVPGLANLHGRFGFNSYQLLVLAMLDLGPWAPSFHHLASGLLLLVSSTHAWWHFGRLVGRRALAGADALVGALPLAGLTPYYFLEASATSTDLPALLLGLMLGLSFFRVLFPPDPDRTGIDIFAVLVLAAAGVTVKLSFVFLGLPVAAVAAAVVLHRAGAGISGSHRVLIVPAVMAAVTLGTWVVRGVILSGYVAYPTSPALGADVAWRVPTEQVEWERAYIDEWSRRPQDPPPEQYPYDTAERLRTRASGEGWFLPWLARTLLRFDLVTVPLILCLVGLAVRARTRDPDRERRRRGTLFLAPVGLAVVFWFLGTPAPRFAGATFWLLGAGSCALAFESTLASTRARLSAWVAGLVVLLFAVSMTASGVVAAPRNPWSLWVTPVPAGGFHAIPRADVRTVVYPSGLVASWAPDTQCWDAPIPCAGTRPNPGLRLRSPGRLGDGFTLDPYEGRIEDAMLLFRFDP